MTKYLYFTLVLLVTNTCLYVWKQTWVKPVIDFLSLLHLITTSTLYLEMFYCLAFMEFSCHKLIFLFVLTNKNVLIFKQKNRDKWWAMKVIYQCICLLLHLKWTHMQVGWGGVEGKRTMPSIITQRKNNTAFIWILSKRYLSTFF